MQLWQHWIQRRCSVSGVNSSVARVGVRYEGDGGRVRGPTAGCLRLAGERADACGRGQVLGHQQALWRLQSVLLGSRQAVIMVYCHPDFSKFECKLDKDHDAVQAHKARGQRFSN